MTVQKLPNTCMGLILKKGLISEVIDNSEHFENAPRYSMNRVLINFTNGYSLSVIRGFYSYGGEKGLFEIASFDKKGEMDGTLLFDHDHYACDDVMGNLTVGEVNKYIEKISLL